MEYFGDDRKIPFTKERFLVLRKLAKLFGIEAKETKVTDRNGKEFTIVWFDCKGRFGVEFSDPIFEMQNKQYIYCDHDLNNFDLSVCKSLDVEVEFKALSEFREMDLIDRAYKVHNSPIFQHALAECRHTFFQIVSNDDYKEFAFFMNHQGKYSNLFFKDADIDVNGHDMIKLFMRNISNLQLSKIKVPIIALHNGFDLLFGKFREK